VAQVRRLQVLAGGALVLVSTAFALPSGASGSPSPAALLRQSLKAAGSAGSVHLVEKTTDGSQVQRLVGSLSAPAAVESLGGSSGGATLQVELVGGTMYVSAAPSSLESALSITAAQATQATGKWVAVQTGDSPYPALAQSLTLASTLHAVTPSGRSLHLGKSTKVGGVKVVPIVGAPDYALPAGTAGSAALFVSAKAPHLPVGGTLVLTHGSQRLTEAVIFTAWGEPVKLTAPTGAIPFHTLIGA
jgi:hypothetical protein